jgi:YVTN family beta-propeller protein
MKKNLYLVLLVFSTLFFACSKDDTVTPPKDNPLTTKYDGVYVINEGLYGQNNSSISFINLTDNVVNNHVYEDANNGQSLGDTGNEMEIFGNKAYVAVDNSNKIEIVNLDNFKSLGFIDLGVGSSPRDVVIIDSTLGYVTSLYTNKLIKFNPASKQVIKAINVGDKPEAAVYANGKIYVTNSGFGSGNTISVIDITTDTEIAKLQVGFNPRFAHKADDGTVYVVCSGQYDATGRGGIYKITNLQVKDSLIVNYNPGESCLAGNSTMLLANNFGLYKVNLTNMSIDNTPLVNSMSINPIFGVIYSVGFDKKNNHIYCGNPKDFQQNGEIVVLDLNGNELKRYSVGINPGTIYIKQ